jgi:hypothetical protein
MIARVLGGVALLTICSSTLAAQVGSTPEKSPFRDLEIRQDVTVVAGSSFGGHDNVGAAPRGGAALGVRYDVNLGTSPLAFTSSVMRQAATRDVLQPGQPLVNRIGANVSQPLWMIDAAFSLLLTGNKSWHSLVPSVAFGGSLVTDNKTITDSSKFDFGNKFSPLVGFGLKYAPQGSRWTIRADMTNRFYNVTYPQTFRDSTPNIPRIVGASVKGSWTRNTMLTLGLVREIGRR